MYPDNTANKRRTRAKPSSTIPNPKRQCPPRKRSPKKGSKQDGVSNLHSHTILPQDIFQDDSSEHMTAGRSNRSNDHTGSDFAILAEQILDDEMPMESDSNLTELLIPVDSGWMEHTKGDVKQHEHMSHMRPPPVSELFKLTRPPEMDEPSTELTPASYDNLTSFSSAPDLSWSSPTTSSHVTSTTPHSKSQDAVTLTASTGGLSADLEPITPLSPGNTIGTEVEEVYAHYPDQSYDQGLEVNTDNIIISEPNREY